MPIQVDGSCAGVSVKFSTSGAECVGHHTVDPVDAATDRFDSLVGRIVDGISVIIGTAGHAVCAGAAVEDIVACSAVEHIGLGRAQQIVGGIALPNRRSTNLSR